MLTTAELNAMNRVTPTSLAERSYGAGRVGQMTVGPSGMPIPRGRSAYRPTVDGALLQRIVTTALGAYERQNTPDDLRQWIADILLDDIEGRFPQAEMLVLKKYGHAHDRTWLVVDLPDSLSFRIELPRPVALNTAACALAYAPSAETRTPAVPVATNTFFEDALHVERLRSSWRTYGGPLPWIAKFKREQKRAPRWEEIEAAFPVVGEWLAAERQRMEQSAA